MYGWVVVSFEKNIIKNAIKVKHEKRGTPRFSPKSQVTLQKICLSFRTFNYCAS
jgi:hypothetical protein